MTKWPLPGGVTAKLDIGAVPTLMLLDDSEAKPVTPTGQRPTRAPAGRPGDEIETPGIEKRRCPGPVAD